MNTKAGSHYMIGFTGNKRTVSHNTIVFNTCTPVVLYYINVIAANIKTASHYTI